MKPEMIFAFFLMILAVLSGILAGSVIQTLSVKQNSGIAWTGLVVGIAIAIMTTVMTTHVALDNPIHPQVSGCAHHL